MGDETKSDTNLQENVNSKGRRRFPFGNYNFSADELRVFKECKNESFYQRSLPLSLSFGAISYWAVKNNYLKPNTRFGAVPKVLIFMTVGYFAGKFSYRNKFAEKIMELPNSRLAEILKENKKKGNLYGCFPPGMAYRSMMMGPTFSETDQNSDEIPKK